MPFFVPINIASLSFPGSLNHFRSANGRLFDSYPVQGSFSTFTLVVNTLYAIGFYEGRGGTIDLLSFNVTLGAAGNVRIGWYDNIADNNVYPNALLLDSGDISVAAAGIKNVALAPNLQLSPTSLYWMTIISSVAGVQVTTLNAVNYPVYLGRDPANFTNTNRGTGWRIATAFGALPNPFPAGATLTVSAAAIDGAALMPSYSA